MRQADVKRAAQLLSQLADLQRLADSKHQIALCWDATAGYWYPLTTLSPEQVDAVRRWLQDNVLQELCELGVEVDA